MNGSLAISGTTSSGFTTSWQAASDNIGVVGYEISVDFGTPAYFPLTNVLTSPKSGLIESTLYNVRVRAFDAAGNRSAPLTTTVTTASATTSLNTLPQSRKIRTSTLPEKRTLTSTAIYLVYNIGSAQELVFYNKSGSNVSVNIKGSLADHVTIPGAGEDTVSLAAGLDVVAPPGVFTFVSLDHCYAYLAGDVTITASVDNVIVACLLA
jgi:hypothetical protein